MVSNTCRNYMPFIIITLVVTDRTPYNDFTTVIALLTIPFLFVIMFDVETVNNGRSTVFGLFLFFNILVIFLVETMILFSFSNGCWCFFRPHVLSFGNFLSTSKFSIPMDGSSIFWLPLCVPYIIHDKFLLLSFSIRRSCGQYTKSISSIPHPLCFSLLAGRLGISNNFPNDESVLCRRVQFGGNCEWVLLFILFIMMCHTHSFGIFGCLDDIFTSPTKKGMMDGSYGIRTDAGRLGNHNKDDSIPEMLFKSIDDFDEWEKEEIIKNKWKRVVSQSFIHSFIHP